MHISMVNFLLPRNLLGNARSFLSLKQPTYPLNKQQMVWKSVSKEKGLFKFGLKNTTAFKRQKFVWSEKINIILIIVNFNMFVYAINIGIWLLKKKLRFTYFPCK